MSQSIDRRVLGAFRCVDAITRRSVSDGLSVTSTQLTLHPNRSAIFVIFNAPGMDALTSEFDPPTWPTPSTFEVSIQDANRRYLPRRAKVQAPRKLPAKPFDPATVLNDPDVIFNPQSVDLFPTPAATLSPNWAVIHISVVNGDTPPKGLPWAVVRVTRSDNNALLAQTVTDRRGEGLLAIPGLGPEVSGSDSGAVTQATVAVTVTAWFDTSTPVPLFDPSVPDRAPSGWFPNPDDIFSNLASDSLKKGTLTPPTQIGPGQTLNRSLAISV